MTKQKRNNGTARASFESIGSKIPPHNENAEKQIIGGLMLDSTAFRIVGNIIKSPDYFYSQTHQNIYEVMSNMNISGRKIDLVSLAEELERYSLLDVIGGACVLSQIYDAVPTAADIENHAHIVLRYYLKRQQIELGAKIIQNGYDISTDPVDDLNYFHNENEKIRKELVINKQKPIAVICDEADRNLDILLKRRDSGDKLIGFSTGLHELDELTGGIINGKYIVVGARTSKGKSSLLVSIARNQIRLPKPVRVGILSGEESDVDFITHIALIDAQINPYKFKKMQFSNQEYRRVKYYIQLLKEANLVVNTPNTIRQQDLKGIIRSMVLDEGAEVIYIDHAQKIKLESKFQGRKQDGYTEVSQTIFSLTRELNIPIVVNAQLNRESENRKDKKPALSDFKESGAFEEDADLVCLIYRPEHDGILTFDNGDTTKSKAQLLIPKHRGGQTGYCTVGFINRYSWFVNENEIANPPRYGDKQTEMEYEKMDEKIYTGVEDDTPF